jgi:Kef-type K+ transport system membrane component KefB
MIVMISAGVLLANGTKDGARALVHDVEAGSLPVYLVFFAVAGAIFRLDLLGQVWLPALALVALRALGFFAGGHLAARRAPLDPAVVRYGWIGLLPQAGLALALAVLIKRSYPGFGPQAAVLVLSVVGINQLLSPVLLRVALVRAGEAGQRLASRSGNDEVRPGSPEPSGSRWQAPAGEGSP